MNKLSALAAAAILSAGLAACSTLEPVQQVDQKDHGAEASYSPQVWSPGNWDGKSALRVVTGEQGQIKVVEVVSGKEAENAEIAFTDGQKTVTYKVTGLKGFQGQASRAEVEKFAAEQLGDIWEVATPAVKDGIVQILEKLISGGVL